MQTGRKNKFLLRDQEKLCDWEGLLAAAIGWDADSASLCNQCPFSACPSTTWVKQTRYIRIGPYADH